MVRISLKHVQNILRPRGSLLGRRDELENRAARQRRPASGCPALFGGSINVSSRITYQTADWN